jgi:hypothetical protein
MGARVSRGQQIAGLGGLLLFVFLFLPWFGLPGASQSGWEGQSSTDIYLLITALVAVATALSAGRAFALPGLSMNGATALLGGVATIILIWLSFLDFPSGTDRKVGVYLSLIAAIVVAYGGYRAALEDGGGRRRSRRERRRRPRRAVSRSASRPAGR